MRLIATDVTYDMLTDRQTRVYNTHVDFGGGDSLPLPFIPLSSLPFPLEVGPHCS